MKWSIAARIALLNGLFLAILTLFEFFGVLQFKLLFSYQWHKLLHLLGVILFMGNLIVGPVWFLFAFYSKDKGLLKFAGRLLYLTDLYLTVPGVALAVVNGLFLASVFGGTRRQPWLFYSVVLMIIMWILSIPLVYLQERLYQSIEKEPDNGLKINQLIIQWGILGTLVSIPPILIFYLMIVKSL
ncbi:MAG: DUF2269 family protein [Saprospiraceae bacterium]